MRAQRFTKRDAIAAIVVTAFLLANLALVGKGGRQRARESVCLSNLGELMQAWNAYADDHDDQIVNGEAYAGKAGSCVLPVAGSHKNEMWWVGSDTDPGYMTGKVLPRDVQVQAVRAGAFSPYCGTEYLYHCPNGSVGAVRTYAICDAMNGLYRAGTSKGYVGVKVGDTVLWVKKRAEITVPGPALRLVFMEEGWPTVASYAVHYQNPRWWDPPWVRHGDGANVTFADGHAEHWTWEAAETVAVGAAEYPLHQFMPTTPEGQRDLQRMQTAVWGRLGY